jgi:colanic acid biosynthesis glycosyl transferase WcaI
MRADSCRQIISLPADSDARRDVQPQHSLNSIPPMRLLVVTNLFFPDRGGGASVFSDLCFSLVRRGWEVDVFTTNPYYPEWRRKSGRSVWSIESEDIQGVRVWRHGIYVPNKPGKLVPRLAYELSFTLSLLRSLLRGGRRDLVMVYCPLLGAVLFTALRKPFFKEPLWLNVQDIPADAAAASGICDSRIFSRLAQTTQRWLFNVADIWSTISPVMAQRLRGLIRRQQPLHEFPNWLNDSMAREIEALPSDKLGRGTGNPVRLLYAGNIGKKQGLLEFCQALAATDSTFLFTIHGDGSERAAVAQFCEESGDKRFKVEPFLDEAGFVRALYQTDLFVITEKSGSGASFIPSKLIPCIATGTPILSVCDKAGPLGCEVNRNNLGLSLEWEQLLDLPAALSRVATQPELFLELQRSCLKRAQAFTGQQAVERFAQIAEKVVFTPVTQKCSLFTPAK